MKIDEIQDMWESDCGIDDNYLGEAATLTPKLHSNISSYLLKLS